MRNMDIVFCDEKSDLKIKTPMDDATRRYSRPITFFEKIEPVNISPKTIIKLKLREGDWKEDGLDYIWKTKKFIWFISMRKTKHEEIEINSYGRLRKLYK